MAYFPEGWWETEHRNVGTGTIWSDWPGATPAYNPGTEVVGGSVQLAEPSYTVLDNFEESTSLSYDLGSSAQQTTSLSYDWAFRGDLSFLLEHDDGYNTFDLLNFDHYSYNTGSVITSVIKTDWTDGKMVIPAQVPSYVPTNDREYMVAIQYNDSAGEFELREVRYNSESTLHEDFNVTTVSDADTVDRWLSDPMVIHTDKRTYHTFGRVTTLSQVSDDVYLSGTYDDYEYEWESSGNDTSSTGHLHFGMYEAGGGSVFMDYLLEGVSA